MPVKAYIRTVELERKPDIRARAEVFGLPAIAYVDCLRIPKRLDVADLTSVGFRANWGELGPFGPGTRERLSVTVDL